MGEPDITDNAHPRGVIVIEDGNFIVDYDRAHSNLFIGIVIESFTCRSASCHAAENVRFHSKRKIECFRHLNKTPTNKSKTLS